MGDGPGPGKSGRLGRGLTGLFFRNGTTNPTRPVRELPGGTRDAGGVPSALGLGKGALAIRATGVAGLYHSVDADYSDPSVVRWSGWALAARRARWQITWGYSRSDRNGLARVALPSAWPRHASGLEPWRWGEDTRGATSRYDHRHLFEAGFFLRWCLFFGSGADPGFEPKGCRGRSRVCHGFVIAVVGSIVPAGRPCMVRRRRGRGSGAAE